MLRAYSTALQLGYVLLSSAALVGCMADPAAPTPATSSAPAAALPPPVAAPALTALVSGKTLNYINSTNAAASVITDAGGTGRFQVPVARVDSSMNWAVPRDATLCVSNINPVIRTGSSFCWEDVRQTGPASLSVLNQGQRTSVSIR